jgi:DNA polymerase-3 subunit gamma/tau
MKYRVYIVDEVHMLSGSAFNALLKTLEEPPEHVIFILATTELQKLPATIISRCQRFDFRRITIPVLTERLMKIAAAEGFNVDDEAARLIARLAQGGMRDAISLLDLCSGTNKDITVSVVEECSGITGRDTMIRTVRAIAEKNYELLFDTIAEVISSSKDLSVFWQDLISVYRDLLVIKTTSNAKKYLDLTDAETDELVSLASLFTKETLLSHSKMLDNSYYTMQRGGASKRMIAEMALVRMCDESLDTSSEAILSRVSKLEDQIRAASFGVPVAPIEVAEAKEEKKPEPKKAEKKAGAPTDRPEKSATVQADTGKPKLRPLRCKMEVAEKLALTDIPASSFFKSAKVFETEGGKVIIKLSNDFAVSMLTKSNTKSALIASLSSALGRHLSENDLTVEKSTGDEEDKYDILDELIND